jgi:hypothetical protein
MAPLALLDVMVLLGLLDAMVCLALLGLRALPDP